MKYSRKIDRENVKIFRKRGTDNSGKLRYKCVICGHKTSIDGSYSSRGHRLVCAYCARVSLGYPSKLALEWFEKGDKYRRIRVLINNLYFKISYILDSFKWFVSPKKCKECKFYVRNTFHDANGEWEAYGCVKRIIRLCCKGERYYESNDGKRSGSVTP